MKTTVSVPKLLCRLCAALCAFAFLFAWMPVMSARAASSAENAAGVARIVKGEEETFYRAVLLQIDEQTYGITLMPDNLTQDSEVVFASVEGKYYHPAEVMNYDSNGRWVGWTITDDYANETGRLPQMGDAAEGDICDAVFAVSTAEISGASGIQLGAVLDTDNSILQIAGAQGQDMKYPAALLNDNMEVVAVALSDTTAIWTGNYQQQSTPGSSGGSGGSGTSSSGSSASAPRPRTNSSNKTPLYFAVGIAVVAVAAVLFLKNKKGGASAKKTNNAAPHIDVTPDDDRTAFFPTKPTDDITIRPAPVPQQQTLWLAATSGYMMGRVYPMENHEITIGRSPTASVPYEDNSVSKQHCKLYKNASGQWMLMDCDSRNGTYLERIGKLSPMQPVEVYPGDTFYLGSQKHGFTIKNN
mgnify:FL=1